MILNSLFGRGTKVPPVTPSFIADFISEKFGDLSVQPNNQLLFFGDLSVQPNNQLLFFGDLSVQLNKIKTGVHINSLCEFI